MSSVRGRRSGSPSEGRRATGRVPRVHQTRPVRAGGRAATQRRPGARTSGRRVGRPAAAAGARRRPLFTGRAVEGDAGTLDEAATSEEPAPWYEGLLGSLADADGEKRE